MARLTCCYDWQLQQNAAVIQKCHFAYYSQYRTRQKMATLGCLYTSYTHLIHILYMILFAESILHIMYNNFEQKNSKKFSRQAVFADGGPYI